MLKPTAKVHVAAGSAVAGAAAFKLNSLSYQVQEVRPAAGSCVIVIKNTGSGRFEDSMGGGGTIKIAFQVVN